MSKFLIQDRNGVRQSRIDRLMTIGRSPGNDLVVNATFASRRHAWVWRQGEQVIVEDLGSTYGTFVNGQKLTAPRFLNGNDVIYIGEAQITYIAERDPTAEVTPPRGLPSLSASQVYCSYCGGPVSVTARFCAHCGHTLSPLLGGGPQEAAGAEGSQVGSSVGKSFPTPRHRLGAGVTPLEPIIARPFPTIESPTLARRDARIWILILSLTILAVILVTIVGVLLVYVLG